MGARLPILRAALLAVALVALAAPAAAQEEAPRNFWRDLFRGELNAQPAPQPAPAPARRSSRPTAPAGAAAGAASSEAAPGAPAAPVAITHRVLVIGDSLAHNLGTGLSSVMADAPHVAVTNRARGSSGLVRDDFYDWPREIAPMLAEEPGFDIGVVMIGLNDRQEMTIGGERLAPLSDPWREAYAARIDALLARFEGAGAEVLWVGLPPMSAARLSSDLAALNEIARARVARAGGLYVDVWQAFLDEEDRFAPNGPTLEGRIARLRAGDGIHFTPAGARKIAHFVDVEIRRLIAADPPAPAPAPPAIAAPDLRGLSIDEIMARLLDPAVSGPPDAPEPPAPPPVGPVTPLTGVAAAPGGALDDGPPPLDRAARLLNERVLSDGVAPTPAPGRADDFRWPRGAGASR